MIKKLLIVGAIATVAFVVLKGTKIAGYVRQEAAALTNWADDQIPVEKKIAQMRKDVGALDKDIERVKNDLAREIVEVRELTTKTTDMRAAVDAERKALVARGESLKDATEKVKLGGRFVSVPEAKDQLKQDAEFFKKKKTQLATSEKMLERREQIKETLKKQLDGLVQKKQEVNLEIDAVEAEFKSLQLQQIESKYQTDDTRLSKIKETLRDLKKKVDVEKERLNLEPKGLVEEPTAATTESVDDILRDVTGGTKPAAADKIDQTKE
ncbi:hypothetical protein [Fimbriiglobus ruber]|uniref:Chromosome partition protein Smc n=1 Tax=Fimbriiglobus ruber TaxID=1908690 RepID=A0A225D8R2_9BACT|nr:hypothetical protein [Fimbriiglobus ruber]OWK37941.1 hypothetical protein FRUB_07061 [Fimbriiglobus ruber]